MIQTHLSKPRLVFDHFSNFFHHKPLLIDKKDTFNLFCVLKQSYNSHNWINPARFTRTVKCFSFVILWEIEKFNLDRSPIERKWFFGFSLTSFRLISFLPLNFLVKVLSIEKKKGKPFSVRILLTPLSLQTLSHFPVDDLVYHHHDDDLVYQQQHGDDGEGGDHRDEVLGSSVASSCLANLQVVNVVDLIDVDVREDNIHTYTEHPWPCLAPQPPSHRQKYPLSSFFASWQSTRRSS